MTVCQCHRQQSTPLHYTAAARLCVYMMCYSPLYTVRHSLTPVRAHTDTSCAPYTGWTQTTHRMARKEETRIHDLPLPVLGRILLQWSDEAPRSTKLAACKTFLTAIMTATSQLTLLPAALQKPPVAMLRLCSRCGFALRINDYPAFEARRVTSIAHFFSTLHQDGVQLRGVRTAVFMVRHRHL